MSSKSGAKQSYLDDHGLSTVINASGTMTALGASRVSPSAIAAMAEIMPEFIRMTDLQRAANRVIRRATGAEAGCVTACAASGISISVAGCMTGTDHAAIERLPDTTDLRNEIPIQMGHLVSYGASIKQTIELAGAKCVPVGEVTGAGAYQLAGTITDDTAAAVYVVSHHTVQSGLISLEDFIRICHDRSVPVIVDAASEYDLRGFLETGADLVVYSGHKFLGGPTSGIIAGRKDLVRAAYFQERGIGRCMKVGKEGVLGAIVALEEWDKRDARAIAEAERERVEYALTRLAQIAGLYPERSPDPTGNPIVRLKVSVDPGKAGLSAFDLSQALAEATPPIQVRGHHVDRGYFFLDPCNLRHGEMEKVCDTISDIVSSPGKHVSKHTTENLMDLRVKGLEKWPEE